MQRRADGSSTSDSGSRPAAPKGAAFAKAPGHVQRRPLGWRDAGATGNAEGAATTTAAAAAAAAEDPNAAAGAAAIPLGSWLWQEGSGNDSASDRTRSSPADAQGVPEAVPVDSRDWQAADRRAHAEPRGMGRTYTRSTSGSCAGLAEPQQQQQQQDTGVPRRDPPATATTTVAHANASSIYYNTSHEFPMSPAVLLPPVVGHEGDADAEGEAMSVGPRRSAGPPDHHRVSFASAAGESTADVSGMLSQRYSKVPVAPGTTEAARRRDPPRSDIQDAPRGNGAGGAHPTTSPPAGTGTTGITATASASSQTPRPQQQAPLRGTVKGLAAGGATPSASKLTTSTGWVDAAGARSLSATRSSVGARDGGTRAGAGASAGGGGQFLEDPRRQQRQQRPATPLSQGSSVASSRPAVVEPAGTATRASPPADQATFSSTARTNTLQDTRRTWSGSFIRVESMGPVGRSYSGGVRSGVLTKGAAPPPPPPPPQLPSRLGGHAHPSARDGASRIPRRAVRSPPRAGGELITSRGDPAMPVAAPVHHGPVAPPPLPTADPSLWVAPDTDSPYYVTNQRPPALESATGLRRGSLLAPSAEFSPYIPPSGDLGGGRVRAALVSF